MLWSLLVFTPVGFAQSAGFNTTFIVLQLNGGSNSFYDLQADTGNPNFNNASLGSFCQGSSSLIFKGGEHNVYKCGGCDLTSTRLYYRIYLTGSPAGSFVSNSFGYTSGFNNGCGGADQRWSSTAFNTNLLNGLTPGNYTLEVYSDASVTCQGGTIYAGNGGANYKANFTVTSNVFYRDADADGYGNPSVTTTSCSGAPAGYVANSLDCDDTQMLFADNDGDGFGSVTPAPCGVANSSDCNDAQLQYLDADGDSFGAQTLVACGVTNSSDCDDFAWTYADIDGDSFGSMTAVACGVYNNSDCNDAQLQYLDADGDSFGSDTLVACGVTNSDDCDDFAWTYADNDGDSFGSMVAVACGVYNNSDCNDAQLQYLDADGDSFGSDTLVACGVTNSDDCDDFAWT